MDPVVSPPCSQEPATGAYPKPHASIPLLPTYFLYDLVQRPPIYDLIFRVDSSLQVFRPKLFRISPMRATCIAHLIIPHLMTVTTFGEAYKVMKLLIIQSSPASCRSLFFTSQYSPHTLFSDSKCVSFLQYKSPHFTPIQNSGYNCTFVCFKTPSRHSQSALHVFVNAIYKNFSHLSLP